MLGIIGYWCAPVFFTLTRHMSFTMASSTSSNSTYTAAFVTAPSEDVAKDLAKGLLKKQLAACINIIPRVTSLYMWKGEMNEDPEVIMMIKTRASRVEELSTYVRNHHPYEVCEVISLPIEAGNPLYLKWLGDTVPEK